jgi:hypothetical protein
MTGLNEGVNSSFTRFQFQESAPGVVEPESMGNVEPGRLSDSQPGDEIAGSAYCPAEKVRSMRVTFP